MPDTYDCCRTAAAVAPLTLREGLLPPSHNQQRRRKAKIHFFFFCFLLFSIFSHETSPLKNASFDIRNPNISPRAHGPRSIQTVVVAYVKSVLTLQPSGHLFSYLARFRGPLTLPKNYQLKQLPSRSASGEPVLLVR